jgi:UDP-2,3-diacylglucosamine pyrophosphatase LpxH
MWKMMKSPSPNTPENYQKKHPNRAPLRYDPDVSAIACHKNETIISVSDLHIGVQSRKKIAGFKPAMNDEQVVTALEKMSKNADHLVLNGDSFELIYPKHETKREARKDYVRTLIKLIDTCETNQCKLHFIAGNHDDNTKFLKQLDKLTQARPDNFAMHPAILRIGSVLFTHGDLPLRAGQDNIKVNERQTGHEKYMLEAIDGPGENQIKNPDKVHRIETELNGRGHYWIQKLFDQKSQSNSAAIIVENLSQAEGVLSPIKRESETVPAVTRICTGHTHVLYTGLHMRLQQQENLSDTTYKNMVFDNTGTPLEAVRFNALEYEIGPRNIRDVRPVEATVQNGEVTVTTGRASHHTR